MSANRYIRTAERVTKDSKLGPMAVKVGDWMVYWSDGITEALTHEQFIALPEAEIDPDYNDALTFISVWCLSKWGIEPELLKFSGRVPELSIKDLAEMMEAYGRHLSTQKPSDNCGFCGEIVTECECPNPL